MNQRDKTLSIADVQATPDTRRLAIDRVGIKAIRHPVKVRERAGGIQHTIAHFNMYVGLPHQFKGTHMSRFVEILNAHEREISPDTFRLMLREMVRKLEAETGHIEMTFPYFVNKKAPISGVQSLMDYEVTFVGEIHDGVETFTLKVLVPVTIRCEETFLEHNFDGYAEYRASVPALLPRWRRSQGRAVIDLRVLRRSVVDAVAFLSPLVLLPLLAELQQAGAMPFLLVLP